MSPALRIPTASLRRLVAWTLLLSAAGVLALWFRSRNTGDVVAVFVGPSARLQAVGSSHGRIGFVATNLRFGRSRAWTTLYAAGDLSQFVDEIDLTRLHIHPAPLPVPWGKGGSAASPLGDGLFRFVAGYTNRDAISGIPESQMFYLLAPHWAVALLLAGLGLWPLLGRAARQQRRRAKGLCVNCGYDLRETRDRCPECGTPIADLKSA